MEYQVETLRIDKWLWAARFFKTRSLAAQAVCGGKVHLNGNRIKASHLVRVGDRLVIHSNQVEFQVVVLALVAQRGPASLARLLYEESAASIEAREKQGQLHRDAGISPPATRPNKRDRRKIQKFIRREEEKEG